MSLRIDTIISNFVKNMKIAFFLLFALMFYKVSSEPKEHRGRPLELDEIRMVKISTIHPAFDDCVAKKKKLPMKYYVKKRLTDRSQNPSLPKYQFVAAFNDLFMPTDKPNEVLAEWGTIFCELSVLNGVTRIHEQAKGCGVEEILPSLCLIDKDVNPGKGINLDMNKVFQGDDSAKVMLKNSCGKLSAIKRPSLPISGPRHEEIAKKGISLIRAYIYGAVKAKYNYLVWKVQKEDAQGNNQNSVWEYIPIPMIKMDQEIQFDEDVMKTMPTLYFCKAT